MSLLVRIVHLKTSQPQSSLPSRGLREHWVIAQEIHETNMRIFHIPQSKHSKSFADKTVVIMDFVFQVTEEELLSSRGLVFIMGTSLQENTSKRQGSSPDATSYRMFDIGKYI